MMKQNYLEKATSVKGESRMKFYTVLTRILIFLLLPVILASCAHSEPKDKNEVSIGWSEIDQEIGLMVGDVLEIMLPAQPTSNYKWDIGFYNQSVLKPSDEPEISTANNEPGTEELQIFHFEAIGTGETELVLVFRQLSGNDGIDQKTWKVYVTVK